MNSEKLYVQHNRWFETEINGTTYRCKIQDYGYSYSTIKIQQFMGHKKRKKYFFFGPMITVPVYKLLTDCHKSIAIHIVVPRRTMYESGYIKGVISKILECSLLGTHSYKI
jgi:hypothetical protein